MSRPKTIRDVWIDRWDRNDFIDMFVLAAVIAVAMHMGWSLWGVGIGWIVGRASSRVLNT